MGNPEGSEHSTHTQKSSWDDLASVPFNQLSEARKQEIINAPSIEVPNAKILEENYVDAAKAEENEGMYEDLIRKPGESDSAFLQRAKESLERDYASQEFDDATLERMAENVFKAEQQRFSESRFGKEHEVKKQELDVARQKIEADKVTSDRKWDAFAERMQKQVEAGVYTAEQANRMLQSRMNKIIAEQDKQEKELDERETQLTKDRTSAYMDFVDSEQVATKEDREKLEKRPGLPDDLGEDEPDGGEGEPDGGEKKPDGGEKEPDGGEDEPDGGEDEPDGGEDEPDDDEKKHNKVNLGKAELSPLAEKIDEQKRERCEELEKQLDSLRPDLAELYAKNRRLFVGAEHRASFVEAQREYEKMQADVLKMKAEASFEDGKQEIMEDIAQKIDVISAKIEEQMLKFVGGNPEDTEKTQEEVDAERERLTQEAKEQLDKAYAELMAELKDKVNAEFLNNYLEEQKQLEEATIDALDNGSTCRKFVSKVLKNKWLKRGLLAAGAVGLAVTGVGLAAGLAAGSLAVTTGFTAGGVAMGAARGGLMGGLMSRQSSETSAVRGFGTENIPDEIKNLNILDEDSDVRGVANWMMGEYAKANKEDLTSNRKRTAVSAGLGAAFGALMSGVKINDVGTTIKTEQQYAGTTPEQWNVDMGQIDIPKNYGMEETFADLGGNAADYTRAQDIAWQIDVKYGLSPGSNGETVGFDGTVGKFSHTYEGTIDQWPKVAQEYITEVAQAWAKAGLIPSEHVGGEAIYNEIQKEVIKYIPNAFYNFLIKATTAVGAGILGNAIGNSGNRVNTSNTPEEGIIDIPRDDGTGASGEGGGEDTGEGGGEDTSGGGSEDVDEDGGDDSGLSEGSSEDTGAPGEDEG